MIPEIVQQLMKWFFSWRPISVTFLCALLVISALSVIYSSHQTRNMYRDLQQLQKSHDDLEHEYEKLLLERAAWTDYTRLNRLAQDELEMIAPDVLEVVVLR
jgi:cell division protein FtsL